MKVSFDGKTALVTGAAGGLGGEVSRLLAEAGAKVVGFDVAPVTTPGVEGHAVDMSDPAAIDAALSGLPGQIDILCNVAGLPQTKPAMAVLSVNFLGLRHLTEALAPKMGAGAVVTNVASNAGNGWSLRRPLLEEVLATADFAEGQAWLEKNLEEQGDPYMFSKELVQLYTMRRSHTMYRELGVRMNCVSPGEMETPMMAEFRVAMGDKILDAVATASTLGRMGTPAEVAPAVLFFSSDLAAFACGAIVDIDGGWTAVTSTDQVDYTVFV